MTPENKFIADTNVGKLARWLRIMGYSTLIFKGTDDFAILVAALTENRIILTRDTQIMKRRLVSQGRVRAILIQSDGLENQLRQIIGALKLSRSFKPFTLCLECNEPLLEKAKKEVGDLVPAYVYETQDKYRECPVCRRIYWQGTHWQRMSQKLADLRKCSP